MTPIILDLCGGTGAWSAPYQEAGYDVRVVTLPAHDVRTYIPPLPVHGILVAPPCTEFARCGARWWKSKPPEKLEEAIGIVNACLSIIRNAHPAWWALENPIGRLKDLLGPPPFTFDPWEFGDPWTKKTWVWGSFNLPKKDVGAVKPQISVSGHRSAQHARTAQLERSLHERGLHSTSSAGLRSITPPGFAQAFFQANP